MAAAVPPTSTASGRIRCKRAADDRTVSHSGKVRIGIVHPEVITLGIGVRDPGQADAPDLLQDAPIGQRGATQFSPIVPAPAGDHIVDCGEGESLMGQVAVEH